MQQLPAEAVKAALDELPEQFRTAVYLADVEGFSYAEIAEIMETPIGTVMSRLHRGRTALQKALYDHAVRRGLISTQEDEAPDTRDPREGDPR
jgi:RNA polymerase sigma-70 factor (ECF subfamily)